MVPSSWRTNDLASAHDLPATPVSTVCVSRKKAFAHGQHGCTHAWCAVEMEQLVLVAPAYQHDLKVNVPLYVCVCVCATPSVEHILELEGVEVLRRSGHGPPSMYEYSHRERASGMKPPEKTRESWTARRGTQRSHEGQEEHETQKRIFVK